MADTFSKLETIVVDEYELFAAVVDAGSLSGAARSLHVSPAVASKRLARLEQRLGTQLIRRTTRALCLTEAGQEFHAKVVEIITAIRQAEGAVSGAATIPSGRLRISVPTSFGRMHLAPYLRDFLSAYPAIRLEVELTDDFVDLHARKIDVAVRIGPPPDKSLSCKKLACNRRLLCAAPAYLEQVRQPKTLEELKLHRLLAADGQLPWRLDGPEGRVVVEGTSHVRTNSSELIRELTLAGLGVALRSTWDVAHDLRSGRLVRVLEEHQGASEVGICAVRPREAFVPRTVTVFLGFLQELYTPVPPWDR